MIFHYIKEKIVVLLIFFSQFFWGKWSRQIEKTDKHGKAIPFPPLFHGNSGNSVTQRCHNVCGLLFPHVWAICPLCGLLLPWVWAIFPLCALPLPTLVGSSPGLGFLLPLMWARSLWSQPSRVG